MMFERRSRYKRALAAAFLTVLVAGVAFLGYRAFLAADSAPEVPRVSSFDECVAAGNPILKSYPAQCVTPDGRTFVDDIGVPAGWVGATVEGAAFAYPEEWIPEYVSTADWPPVLRVTDEEYACTEAGEETERAGETTEITLESRTYCRTMVSEGAAGSVYIQYAYAFPFDGRTAIFTFSLRYPQCLNYDEPEQQACFDDQEGFDVDRFVDQIAQTVVVQ